MEFTLLDEAHARRWLADRRATEAAESHRREATIAELHSILAGRPPPPQQRAFGFIP